MSDFIDFVPSVLSHFEQACEKFKAGQVANHLVHWTKITSDKEILSNVSGGSIELTDTPIQHSFNVRKFQPHEYPIMDGEIAKLLVKGVTTKVANAAPGQIVSSIFLHPKKDGSHSLILNLN